MSLVSISDLSKGCIHGATGKHIWDMHLDRVLNESTLNVWHGSRLIRGLSR